MLKQIPKKLLQHFFTDVVHKEFIFSEFEIPVVQYTSGNISFYETVILCLLCKNLNPKFILEYGTFNGKTTVNLAANTSVDTVIVTVDLPKNAITNTVYPLEGLSPFDQNDELGYIGQTDKIFLKMNSKIKNKIKQVWLDTALFPMEEEYSDLSFDFIFVDASHKYENVLNDSKNVFKLIKPGGIIIWHDYNGWDGVTKALDEIYDEHENKENFAFIPDSSLILYYQSL